MLKRIQWWFWHSWKRCQVGLGVTVIIHWGGFNMWQECKMGSLYSRCMGVRPEGLMWKGDHQQGGWKELKRVWKRGMWVEGLIQQGWWVETERDGHFCHDHIRAWNKVTDVHRRLPMDQYRYVSVYSTNNSVRQDLDRDPWLTYSTLVIKTTSAPVGLLSVWLHCKLQQSNLLILTKKLWYPGY